MSKQAGELEVIPSPLNGRVARLDSAAGVLREMARIYRAARTGRIPMADASRLTYMLSSMGRLFETVELEQRVTALETRR